MPRSPRSSRATLLVVAFLVLSSAGCVSTERVAVDVEHALRKAAAPLTRVMQSFERTMRESFPTLFR